MNNAREKAEEFFNIMAINKKRMIDIPIYFSQGEPSTLRFLASNVNGTSISQISKAINVSMPRAMSLMNSLEAKGLVVKTNNNIDKRKTIVYISKLGKEVLESRKNEAINYITKIVEKLDEKDIENYIRIGKKISAIIDELNTKEV